NPMMTRASVHHLHVHVRTGTLREPFEEILQQFRLQVADEADTQAEIDDGVGASAEVHGGDAERLVHRHQEVPGPVDADLRPERLRESLAERDADVLDRVVLIHVEIARGLQLQVEAAMLGKQLEHVVEKPDAGADLVPSLALDPEGDPDLRLAGLADDYALAQRISSMAAMHCAVCSTSPVVMRMQPSHPGWPCRSRT